MIYIIKLPNTFMFNFHNQNTSKGKSKQVIFTIGDFKVLYSVLESWSVNKTKCLLISQYPKLKFNEFELMHSGKLIKGNTKIRDISPIQNTLSLIVINTKSQISFQQYYGKTMEFFLMKSKTKYEPIMDVSFQKSMKYLQSLQGSQQDEKFRGQDMIQLNQAIQNGQNLQDLPQLFKILRLFGLTMFLSILLLRGETYQIALMLIIFCSHYLIDVYRAYCKKNQKINKKSKQKQDQPNQTQQNALEPIAEHTPLNNLKAIILLRIYKTIQIIFCFLLTFYPNWDLRLHFNINGNRILNWRNQINRLRPNQYPNKQKLI